MNKESLLGKTTQTEREFEIDENTFKRIYLFLSGHFVFIVLYVLIINGVFDLKD